MSFDGNAGTPSLRYARKPLYAWAVDPWMAAAMLVATALLAVGSMHYQRTRHQRRDHGGVDAVRQARRVALSEIESGAYQKVVGEAQPTTELLVAPLTKRPCIGYMLRVTEVYQNGSRELIDEQRASPFLVQDPSGKALVKTQNCTLLLEPEASGEAGLVRRATPELRRLLDDRGQDPGSGLMTRSFVFSEGVIAEGERVAVLGLVVREQPGADDAQRGVGYRDETRLVFAGETEWPLLICDHAQARM
jgi:hypothetical protein